LRTADRQLKFIEYNKEYLLEEYNITSGIAKDSANKKKYQNNFNEE